MNVIKALLNGWQLFANEPPNYLSTDTRILGEDRIQVKSDILHFLKTSDAKPIFIIGAWGSGKTAFVRSLEKDLKKRFRYSYRSFFAVSNSNEAYLTLLPRCLWLGFSLLFLFILVTAGVAASSCTELRQYKEIILVGASLATFLFITNKMKLFYICASFFNMRLWGKPFVTVIDDLERSSLSQSTIWAILSNLWMVDHKYLVLLGFDSDEEKTVIIERAIKLEGHLVFLPTDYGVNLKIAKALDPAFPFKGGEWLGRLAPRDIVRIHSVVERESSSYTAEQYREVLYINQYFLTLLKKLGIKKSDYSHIHVTTTNDSRGKQIIISLRSWGSTQRNPLFHIGPELSQFKSSLSSEIELILFQQAPGTVENLLKTDNIFQVRRLFGSFVGLQKV